MQALKETFATPDTRMIRNMDEPIQTIPQHDVPQSKPQKTAPWKVPVLAGSLIIILAAGAYYLMQREPADAQAFTYIEISPIGEVARVLEGNELIPPAYEGEGIVSEYLKRGSMSVGIVRTLTATSTETNSYRAFDTDVVILSEGRQLTDDGIRKTSLAIASDGTQIAYAYVDSENQLANDNPQPADWSVAVVSVASGEVMRLGKGTAPHFVDSAAGRVIVFVTTDGLAVYDLSTGASSSYNAPAFQDALTSLAVSPDGKHLLVRDRGTEQHAVYAIGQAVPSLTLTLVGYVPSLIAATLSNERVYGLAVNRDGATEIRSYPIENLNAESRLVRTIPEGSSVIRLIPHY